MDYLNTIDASGKIKFTVETETEIGLEFLVKLWIHKWHSNKTLSNDWVKFITPEHSKPGKMYDNVKTHKKNNR